MSTNRATWSDTDNNTFKKGSSIRTKIIVAAVLVSFVTASLITVVQVRTICQSVLVEAQVQSEALTLPVKQTVDALVVSGPAGLGLEQLRHSTSNIQVRKVLGDILNWPGRRDLVAAYVTDVEGKVLVQEAKGSRVADVRAEVFNSRIKDIERSRIVRNGSRYDTFVPYYSSPGQVAGYLVLGISAQSLWDRAGQLATGAVVTFAIISVITVSMFGFWVSQHMVKPLERIREGIVHGAKTGRPRLGKLAKSADEIGHLAQVTDEVMPELYRQQQELKATGQLLAGENAKLERTKLALMEMERYYRSAVEAATGVAYELDLATGKFEFLSRQVYEMVGFAAEDLASSDVWAEHIHRDERAEAKESLSACLAGQKSCFFRTYRFVCKDGHELQVIELGGLITDEAGRPARISGIIIPAHMMPKSLLATS